VSCYRTSPSHFFSSVDLFTAQQNLNFPLKVGYLKHLKESTLNKRLPCSGIRFCVVWIMFTDIKKDYAASIFKDEDRNFILTGALCYEPERREFENRLCE
jgi:hypothetical protein